MLRLARTLHRETGTDDLCLAGGVALNCVGNGRVLREAPYKRLWVQPAAGDACGAVGGRVADEPASERVEMDVVSPYGDGSSRPGELCAREIRAEPWVEGKDWRNEFTLD